MALRTGKTFWAVVWFLSSDVVVYCWFLLVPRPIARTKQSYEY